jgi:hypothetical protein
LVIGNVFFGKNGIHRTLGNANSTVNALLGVDDKEVRPLAKTINGTDIDAVGVTASNTGFSNNVGHGSGRLNK